ncbi:WXG100 family type VII secretion target [Nocardia coubleae]|uniref:WXG100 family type VII secretion target n=1 Tax=Nocardia coubleae TaxID=356147 RepID=A0A846W5R0_9NOCA|nr:WXG100 family type VII secretion target [Nocardia coubleae]NKX88415.1 WXG100 family type VII secretion target [Nocardia coubleae]
MRSISGAPGTDPDYVAVVEVFDSLSHSEIHTAVQQLDPAALSSGGQLYLTAATAVGDEVDNAHAEIRAAIADGWRGSAAQSAVDALRTFEQVGRQIADVLTAVGVRLCQAGDAAESIRAAVAEPAAAQPDPDGALLDPQQATDNATISREAENARLDAVQAMETIYAGAFVPTGSGVPAFGETSSGTTDVAVGSALGAAPSSVATVVSGEGSDVAVTGAAAGSAVGDAVAGSTADGSGAVVSPASVSSSTASTSLFTGGSAAVAPAAVASGAGASSAVPGAGGSVAASGVPVVGPVPAGTLGRTGKRANASRKESGSPATQVVSLGESGSPATRAASSEDVRQDPTVAGGEAAAGMSAGAIGGLMGGAMVAADHTRAPGGPRPPAQPDIEDDDDEFLRFLEEEPTFLEPADEVNPLIGKLEPTSPAVLGEWTEQE